LTIEGWRVPARSERSPPARVRCHRASGRVEMFPPRGLPEGPQVLLPEILGNATIPAVEVEAPAALVKADGGHQAAYSE
jgi:hypothetical protein